MKPPVITDVQDKLEERRKAAAFERALVKNAQETRYFWGCLFWGWAWIYKQKGKRK